MSGPAPDNYVAELKLFGAAMHAAGYFTTPPEAGWLMDSRVSDKFIGWLLAREADAIEPSLTPVQLTQESVKKSKSANIPQFPTTIRKMWSGSEVQDWINKNWNTVNND